MKEMIKRLIEHGYAYAGVNEDGETYVSWDEGIKNRFCVPFCLFQDLEIGSQIELKMLLIDDEEQDNIQREIKMLIVWKFEYLLKQGNGEVHAYSADGTEWRNANRLKNFVPEVHEKVYLKDLVKKRKVKKSVWFGRSLTDYYLTVDGVAYSHTEKFPFEFLFQGRDKNVTEFELTYEVEE